MKVEEAIISALPSRRMDYDDAHAILASLRANGFVVVATTSDEPAKLLAEWIGYSWDGLRNEDISDKWPDWAFNGIGRKHMQGGKPALRKIATAMIAAAQENDDGQ